MEQSDAVALLDRCRRDPTFFATEILGITPWSRQIQILDAVRINRRTAVRACRGVGKTYIAAVIVLWFLYCYGPGTKVITTAPTQRQVRELLWSEIRALHARAEERGYTLGGTPSSVRLDVDPLADPDWYAVGISSDDPDKYLGFHAPAILFLVDEASGVPQAILDAAKGYGTGATSRTLYIGNGTQTSGGLYDAFTSGAELWTRIGVSMFDSPNFTEENVAAFPRVREYMERNAIPYTTEQVPDSVRNALPWPETVDEALVEWGEDSPLFAVFVLGEFPGEGANTVIGLQKVMQAQARYAEWEPTDGVDTCDVICDVARFGDDETVIAVREHGDIDRLTIRTAYQGQDTMRTAGEIMEAVALLEGVDDVDTSPSRVEDDADSEHDAPHLTVKRIIIDDAGVGGGVVDRLRELQREGALARRISIVGFNGGGKPRKKGKGGYPNARSEAWFAFLEALEGVALDPDPKLLADLVAPTYELDSAGRRVVEQKKHTKKRLGRSPDRADTALMAYAPSGFVTRGKKSKGRAYA